MLARRIFQAGSIRQLFSMGGSQSIATNAAATEFVKTTVTSDCVVVFSKTTCGFCRMAKNVLSSTGVDYTVIEVNQRKDGPEIQDALQSLTGLGTVPQVFISGKCVGGGTETKKLHKEGKLIPLLQQCDISAGSSPSKL